MSASTANTTVHPVSVQDVIAIHREIAALVRAGIPLEIGLRTFSGGLPTRLCRVADRIADRLTRGETLADAIRAEQLKDSSVYAAVIGAGIRSGNLAEALESIAASAEQLQEIRQNAKLAMVYPWVVITLATLLFGFFISYIAPMYIDSADAFGFGNDMVFRCLRWLYERRQMTMLVIVPAACLAIFACYLIATRSFLGAQSIFRWLNQAQFAEILKIQIEQGLPITESFVRAAQSTSDKRLRLAAAKISEDLKSGVSFSSAVSNRPEIPPMTRWLLSSGARQGTLVETLNLMADSYRRRTFRRARILQVWLPTFMTIVVAGSIAFVYGLFFFGILSAFWEGLLRE